MLKFATKDWYWPFTSESDCFAHYDPNVIVRMEPLSGKVWVTAFATITTNGVGSPTMCWSATRELPADVAMQEIRDAFDELTREGIIAAETSVRQSIRWNQIEPQSPTAAT